MTPFVTVATSCDSKNVCETIANSLVNEKLAACVQISGPVNSCYRWQGKVESSMEWVCTAKTSAELYDRVEHRISELHSYDEPEIIATPIVDGSSTYIAWLEKQLLSAAK